MTKARVALVRDRRGGSFAEYLILVALVAVGALAGWRAFAARGNERVEQYAGCIESMSSCGNPGGTTAPGGATTPGGGVPLTAAAALETGGSTNTGGDTNGGGGGDKAWYDYLWEGVKGTFVDGLWGDVTGVWDMVTHPIDTVKGLVRLGWITSPLGLALDPSAREDLSNIVTHIWNESYEYVTEHPDRAVGRAIYEIATFVVAPAKLLKIGKASKATKAAKIINVLDDANTLRKIIDNADEVAKARKWADDVLKATSKGPDPAFIARKAQIKDAWTKVKTGELRLPDEFMPGLTHEQKVERLKLAIEGDPTRGGQRLPLTFKDWEQYDRFKADLDEVLKRNGIDDATVQQIGSGAQGWKGNPKKANIFNPDGTLNPEAMWRASSDTDFAVFSDKAVTQGKAVNAKIKTEYGTFKNGSAPGEPGFDQTPLGRDLKALSAKWNREIYGTPDVDGFDFKINLSNKPFKSAPTITTPSGNKAPVVNPVSKADEAEEVIHGADGDD